MNRFIQKTTSVILSLATVALIGAPAFAAYEPQEALNDTPAAAAEAVAEPTEGRDKIETTESGKEETAQAQTVETASAAAVEEPTEEKSETETAVPEETADETETEIGGSELPEISKEEIEEILRSDEVINALEEAGVDGEEIEDIIENEEYEVIYVTKKEFEKMRLNAAIDAFKMGGEMFLGGILCILLIPFSPIVFFIPFAGPLATGVILFGGPIGILYGLLGMIVMPYAEYNGFELKEPYVLIEE